MITGHFERIRIFLAVARKQSFTTASSQFEISQSAVTQHIQKLEKQLGWSLFKRSREKSYLTPKGEELYALALRVEKIYRFAEDEIALRYPKRMQIESNHKPKETL